MPIRAARIRTAHRLASHPVILANGLDVASFAVNIGIAAGTLAAAGIALWLGLAASHDQASRDERAGSAERRQIAAVLTLTRVRHARKPWASVNLINESSDLITDLVVMMQATTNHGAPASDPAWLWATDPPPTFLPSEQSWRGAGSFHSLGVDQLPDRRTFASRERSDMSLLLAWGDAHGNYWARTDGRDPYPTSPAMPTRDITNFVYLPTRRQRVLRRLRLTGRTR